MKQIPYGTASFEIGFIAPMDWDVSLLSAVNVSIKDFDGTVVLASTASTLWTATTTDGAILQFDKSLKLTSGATAPSVGDVLTISGSSSSEDVIVEAYDATTLTVTTESLIQHAYEDDADVYNNKISYSIDCSDTDTFTAGKILVATWTPVGTGTPFKVELQITKFIADTSDLKKLFGYLHPRAHDAFLNPLDRFDDMVSLAQTRVEFEMRCEQMDYHRIIGEPIVKDLLMSKMACLWLLDADEDLQDEREEVKADYASLFAMTKQLPIWTDTNQDDVKETLETSSHNHIFLKGW